MPRFFFHVLDARNILDDAGLELPGLEDAKREALRFAGAIIRDEMPDQIWQGQPWRLQVSTSSSPEDGEALLTLTLLATGRLAR